MINTENADGFSDPVQMTITVAGEATAPEAEKLTGDVNGDATVNIFDLVIATGNFGQSLLVVPATAAKMKLSTDQKRHIVPPLLTNWRPRLIDLRPKRWRLMF